MSQMDKHGAKAVTILKRLAMPAAYVLSLTAVGIFFAYQIHLHFWHAHPVVHELELLLLSICAVFLAVILVALFWRLVRAQAAKKIMRSNLVQYEARLKILIQTIPDLIWLKDEQGAYLACNPAFERFFGKKESEIVGKTDYDFVDRELADFFRENDLAALGAGHARRNEEWITFADTGQRARMETIKVPVRTGDGELIGVMGIARDITRRYEAEKDAALFRNLVELSGDPVYVLDREDDFRMVFVNQSACRHFGAPVEEIVNWRVFDWDPDVTREDLAGISERSLSGEAVVFETRHRSANGKIVPVEVSASNFSHDGRDLSAGYIRDISERKRAEAALRQSHQQLFDLASNVPGVVFQLQRFPCGRRQFPFVGDTVRELYGVTPEQIYVDSSLPFAFTHPDDMERLEAAMNESALNLTHWRHEFRVNLPHLGTRWLLGQAKPERQRDGSIIWHGFITDITEIKRIEESLHTSQEQLRQLLAHQDQIREGERKLVAREVHDLLGQELLALRIDISMLPQIERNRPGFERRVDEMLSRIDNTMKSIRAIINNLRPSVLDLGIFAALEWQAKAFQRRTGIACEVVGDEEELQLDEKLAIPLFRVMQEALSNVARHAQATQVRIAIRCVGSAITMTVADNGIGMDSIAHGTKDAFGLFAIRERIGMLGGEARIDGANGTRLTVSLPLGVNGASCAIDSSAL